MNKYFPFIQFLFSGFLAIFCAADSFSQTCANNLLANPGFENNLNDWNNLSGGTIITDVNSGSKALTVCGTTADADYRVVQGLPATPGHTYTFSAFAKKGSGGNTFDFITIKFLTSSFQPIGAGPVTIEVASTTYQQYTSTHTAPANAAYVEVGMWHLPTSACLFVDDLCLTVSGSAPCSINAIISNIQCFNNGTANNPSDDYFLYTATVNQTGNCGSGWSGAGGANIPYGASTTSPTHFISDGSFFEVFQDNANLAVPTQVQIYPPAPCSNGGTGNCEQVLSPSPAVCAMPLANGNFEVAVQVGSTVPFKRYEYSPTGSLVTNLPDSPYPATPATTVAVENGSIVERNTASGAIISQVALPANITSTMTQLFVCKKTGASQYFLTGTHTSNNKVLVLLLNASAGLISTLNTNVGGFANDIVPTSWGGAILGRSNNFISQSTPAGGTLYVISAANTLLYSFNKVERQFTFTPLPCGGTDAFRVNSDYIQIVQGNGVSYNAQEDYQFGQASATLWRTRRLGTQYSQPISNTDFNWHIFPNADGTSWKIIRAIRPASAPQYNAPPIDSMYYEKLSATGQVLLSQGLDKTKFDALADIQIYAVAELQPGKLAFFGRKNGQAWYYNPFCAPTTLPDMTPSNIQILTGNIVQGGMLDLTFQLGNLGPGDQSGNFVVKTYISTDNEVSADDVLLESINTGDYPAGYTSIGFESNYTVPASLTPGNYFFMVQVDAQNDVAEGNENNNIASKAFTLLSNVDVPDCNTITITPGQSKITIAGFSAPHVLIKVFRPNWTVAFECLDGTCTNPQVVNGLSAGNHFVEMKLLNADWSLSCTKNQTVSVSNFSGGGISALKIGNDRSLLAFDNIHPNPAIDFVTLEVWSPKEQDATLDFYNTEGSQIHRENMQLKEGKNDIQLDVSQWKPGMYNVIGRGKGLPDYGRFLKIWEE